MQLAKNLGCKGLWLNNDASLGATEINDAVEQLRKEMPITPMDSLKGVYEIMMLRTGWPFNQPIARQFKVDSSIDGTLAVKVALGQVIWPTAMGQMFRYYQKKGNDEAALKVAEAMVLQYPQNKDFYGIAGNLSTGLKDYDKAAFYYKKLHMLNEDFCR